MVQDRRGEKLGSDPDIFTGKFWTGAKGVELGLADGVGHMSTVLKERYGKDTKLKLVQQKRGLFGRGSVGIADGFGGAVSGKLADTAVEIAEERSLRARFGL